MLKLYSAYEIAKYWHETPPPPEILEQLTAKGGNLRTRKLEDYQTSKAGSVADGVDTTEEGPGTPSREGMDTDEPGSASRYPKRKS